MRHYKPLNDMISERVRAFRKAAGVSMESLGQNLSPPLTQQMISRYETNGTRWFADTLVQIADVLNVDLLQLLGLENEDALSDPTAYDKLILCAKFEKLNPSTRKKILAVLDILLEIE